MKWHKIPESVFLNKKPIQQIMLGSKDICLIYEEEKWHATSSKCPHAGANLAGGWCENGKIICPYHRHSFDLENGKGAPGQYNAITIYKLEEREDGLFVELPENLLSKLSKIFR